VAFSADDLARDLRVAHSAHRLLLTSLDRVAGGLDPRAPTRLPGWTVGHLLTHLARNADSHRRMIEAADRGEVADQYEGGAAGRDADIERGAGRSLVALLADATSSAASLEEAWAATRWEGSGRRARAAGPTAIVMLPFLRAREASIHLVDLDVGVGFADLDPLYVRLELVRLEMSWKARQPMGLTPLPPGALALEPWRRLAWLTGRLDVDGLAPASVL
jgi:maleylpyruvate isomerase